MEEDLVDQFFNFSEKRLAGVRLLFGQMIKESKPEDPLKVSQATLAEMVGTTRARVSEFMSGFKKKGFVSYNGSPQINSALVIAFLQSRPMSVATKRWTQNDQEADSQTGTGCPLPDLWREAGREM